MRLPSLSLHGTEGALEGPRAKTGIPTKVGGEFRIRPRNLNITVTYVPNVQFTTFRHPSPEHSVVITSVKLYRCAAIWGSSRYSRIVVAFPSLLILSTFVGIWGIFEIDTDTPIPFSLALVTNFLGLTAGRIRIKGRQAIVVLGVQAGRRYGRTLEIM
ncbi:hypothetical protein FB451DRAFT_1393863 [Mycena latifolia]|nr:hypothetical protein FB451DRAFT_1393863 [Mycena latifolia]